MESVGGCGIFEAARVALELRRGRSAAIAGSASALADPLR